MPTDERPGAQPTLRHPAPAAPLWRRLASAIYDLLPLAALWFLLAAGAVALNRGEAVVDSAGRLLFVGLLLVTVLYLGISYARGGQTLGMRAWHVRIQDASGRPLPAGRAYLRAAAGIIQLLPLGIGLWWALIDRERQSLADRLCRTRLVRVGRSAASARVAAMPDRRGRTPAPAACSLPRGRTRRPGKD